NLKTNHLCFKIQICKNKFCSFKNNNYICILIANSNFVIMDIVSRLKQYLDHEQISVTQFADYCGIPRPSASQLLNGRNKKVSDEVISKIHTSYPTLSMLWLLFGEGDMLTVKNIETSEPQIPDFPVHHESQPLDSQAPEREFRFAESVAQETPEKFRADADRLQSDFDVVKEEEPVPYGYSPRPKSQAAKPAGDDTFTFTTNTGKRVISIVVYYDDNSFESFIPDSSRHNPFVR
ncbi:MAG: helix-turn-helix transcriptional regulator, partial [Duncaniella sp.]|nr:helix-turn-helix transcriptional regulator [Duncaniella sp.]